jgi:hypothetical protein
MYLGPRSRLAYTVMPKVTELEKFKASDVPSQVVAAWKELDVDQVSRFKLKSVCGLLPLKRHLQLLGT